MRIGIFFMVDSVAIYDALPIEQGERYGDCVEYGAHYDYWLSLKPTTVAESAFKSHAYGYYPRGRAICDIKHNQVKLYVNRCERHLVYTTINIQFHLIMLNIKNSSTAWVVVISVRFKC